MKVEQRINRRMKFVQVFTNIQQWKRNNGLLILVRIECLIMWIKVTATFTLNDETRYL